MKACVICPGLITVAIVCALAASAENTQGIAARAVQQMEARDFQAASVTLQRAIKASSARADLWNLLGICESELNHAKGARDAFEKGLTIAPDSVSILENLGFLYFREADYFSARIHLLKAVAAGSTKPGAAFSLAASEIRTGEREQGLKLLLELEQALSGQADYWTERGWVELSLNPKAAEAAFERALAIAPTDIRALNGAASWSEAQHEDEKALRFLLDARKAQPDDLRTLLHFGSLCLRLDLTVDAVEAIGRARELSPGNNLALFLDGRAQLAMQQWQKSHDLFTEFDRRVPNYAPTQYALGWLDIRLNRSAEARQHLERSLKLDPRQYDAWLELGQLELDAGNLDTAEKQLRTALAGQPLHAKANFALGDLMMKSGNLPAARTFYKTAIEADPKSGPAHYKLATVLMRLGETEPAEKEREIGTRLNAEALKASKTVLVLADPDGTLLTGGPGRMEGRPEGKD